MPLSDLYIDLNAVSDELGESNDCAVVSLAVASGLSYQEAREVMRGFGRNDKDGASLKASILPAFRYAGLQTKRITSTRKPKSKTTWSLARSGELSEGTFIISTSDHICTMKDGELHDWSINRKLRIQGVYEVTKANKGNKKGSKAMDIKGASLTEKQGVTVWVQPQDDGSSLHLYRTSFGVSVYVENDPKMDGGLHYLGTVEQSNE